MFFGRDFFPGNVEVGIMQMGSLHFGYLKQKCLEGKSYFAMPATVWYLTRGLFVTALCIRHC